MDDLHLAIRATANQPGGRHRLRVDSETQPRPAAPTSTQPAAAVFGIPLAVAAVLALELAALFGTLALA